MFISFVNFIYIYISHDLSKFYYRDIFKISIQLDLKKWFRTNNSSSPLFPCFQYSSQKTYSFPHLLISWLSLEDTSSLGKNRNKKNESFKSFKIKNELISIASYQDASNLSLSDQMIHQNTRHVISATLTFNS